MRNTLLPITASSLRTGITKLNTMLSNTKTTEDMLKVLPYYNLILNHLEFRKNKKLENEVFERFWKRYGEINYV